MLRMLGSSPCAGCGRLVNVWYDGVHHVMRERSMVESPVHVCHEPTRRERVEMTFLEIMGFRCPRCGDPDVAYSTWGRVVDFPGDASSEGWAEAWVGPLQEHVCQSTTPARRNADVPRSHNLRPAALSGVDVPEL